MESPVVHRKLRLVYFSGALALLIGTVYALVPLAFAAVYIWPLTLWTLIGTFLALVALKSPAKLRMGVVCLWLAVWLLVDDQPWAFLPRIPSQGNSEFRIVSLNCAGGDPLAAAEAASTGADLILLQESPGAAELQSISESLGSEWTAVHGPDGSILARGPARRVPLPAGTHNFVAVEWSGSLVLSLRLQPPVFRLDYWSSDCWRAFTENRESRLVELRKVMDWVRANRGDKDVIIGGDFNTPPDRLMMADLKPLARDAFAERGQGWGATAINAFPMVRIDQIWVGGNVVATEAWAKTSLHSDHRMVIVNAYRAK